MFTAGAPDALLYYDEGKIRAIVIGSVIVGRVHRHITAAGEYQGVTVPGEVIV